MRMIKVKVPKHCYRKWERHCIRARGKVYSIRDDVNVISCYNYPSRRTAEAAYCNALKNLIQYTFGGK